MRVLAALVFFTILLVFAVDKLVHDAALAEHRVLQVADMEREASFARSESQLIATTKVPQHMTAYTTVRASADADYPFHRWER